MVCVITYFNYITTHTFPLGSEKGMSYYIFTMVCPNTEYVLLSILLVFFGGSHGRKQKTYTQVNHFKEMLRKMEFFNR